MTKDQLESAIWRAMHRHAVRTPHGARFVDAILKAAGEYALTEYGITADRRAAIGVAPGTAARDLRGSVLREPVHYAPGTVAACGKLTRLAPGDPGRTGDPAKVTCGSCQRTGHYRQALAQEVAS